MRPTKVIVRIDWESLVRGWPIDEEICDMTGVGPVPVTAVREMIASGDVFLAAIVTKGQDVVNVAHLGRRPSATQRTALDWMNPGCMVASPQMLLALKVAAHRIGEDEDDIRLLVGHLGLTTASEVLEVAEARMGDRLDPAARFFVEELFGVE
ncbi:MAG TPA: hypothetical protein VM142_04980 [Acidimicrobiales bacterium]|nr:hypothetical protein [Acidimicrobiales bacterium]